jgi:hypothetical protein
VILSCWGGTKNFVAGDDFLSDIIARNTELGTSLAITGLMVTSDGAAKSQPAVVPGVPAGQSVTFLTLALKDPTVHANSVPLIYIDETAYPPLPILGNGLDLVFQPDWLASQGWWKP